MKNFFSTIIFLCYALTASAQEIVVSPGNSNGWTFGTASPYTKNSAAWFLGYMGPMPQIGYGDLWLYSGRGDGLSYGQTSQYHGTPLSGINRLSYSTFTGFGMNNVAPTMNLFIDVNEDGKGDVWLEFNPALNATVPLGRWTTWAPLQGKWWNNKFGVENLRSLPDWLTIYPNANIEIIRVQAGTWDKVAAENWRSAWYGVDMVTISNTLNTVVNYNFEPDQSQGKALPSPTVGSLSTTNTVVPYIVVNPISIAYPVYYIFNGETVNQTEKPISTESTKKTEVYKASDGVFVPVLFLGNSSLQKVLSQLNFVGNPDKTIPRGDIRVTEGGAYLFGGVPFYIPEKNNTWDSNEFTDSEEHKLFVPVNLKYATEVRTIMGLTYATGAPNTVYVEFRGSKGAFFKKEFVVNQDIRDMRTSNFSKIKPPTQKVWSRPLMQLPKQGKDWEMYLDEQTIVLPEEFSNQELVSITFVDKGKHNAQRSFLSGITVKVKKVNLD